MVSSLLSRIQLCRKTFVHGWPLEQAAVAGPVGAIAVSALAGAVDNAVIETIERLLRAPSQLGLYTRTQCLEYLGSLFRNALDTLARLTDLQVNLFPDPC